MILQALNEYYKRKAASDPQTMAPPGFEWKEVPFVFELATDGKVIQIEDTRERNANKLVGRRFLIPQSPKRASNIAAGLLWDNCEYALGMPDQKKLESASDKDRYVRRVVQMHEAFIDRIRAVPPKIGEDAGVASVLRFLGCLNTSELTHFQHWITVASENPVITFRLQGDSELVCQRERLRQVVISDSGHTQDEAFCAISGQPDEVARLHQAVKGVFGAQTSGANIVSFNLDAFNSYGKSQGANAPVGKSAAFAYTTALNRLLARDSRQRLQIGDATTVFWSDRSTELETTLIDLFGEPPKDDPDRNTRAVRALYEAPHTGMLHADDASTKFFVLGLAPNAARIAVRFWYATTVSELVSHIRLHFEDLDVVQPGVGPQHFSLFRLLLATAPLGQAKNIHPKLAGDVMRSILQATPYPNSLLQAVLLRIRAEHEVTYIRAALLKACINRNDRFLRSREKELTVSLDENNMNTGYRLGRLFAVLEKVQEEANPGINATIRDRFYGAASSTPVAVFSRLMNLKNHHLAKLENRGRVVNLEKLIGEIVSGIAGFPAHLSLNDQGRFVVGYYHQRQAFFVKTPAAASA